MSEMLGQTKEEIQRLVAKVEVINFVLNSLNMNHKDYSAAIEEQYKQASNHKLKLTSEILRLVGAEKVAVAPPLVPIDVA